MCFGYTSKIGSDLFMFEVFVDIIFVMDIVVNFRTGCELCHLLIKRGANLFLLHLKIYRYIDSNDNLIMDQSKSAWNVIGTKLGGKYKIARIPYETADDDNITERNRSEARMHAWFISYCFNNSDNIFRIGSAEKKDQSP